ncbi:MAG: hypothetical protein K0S76_1674 [Herbinix sp.]|jgi:NarL family two-component system sensor histidine kinase LiaS|nr:hypothetical protein [Herbinix sp.]
MQNMKLIEFLSGLSAVTLERFHQEEIENSLIVMEEQNRIANEIHDSVSQRLFSISYAIHGLLGRWTTMSKEELKGYLVELNETSNYAMQELRNSIYQLSSKKNGKKSLQIALRELIHSISKLHSININYELTGDDERLPLSLKKGITRIIQEACSNAIRHGKCRSIRLNLNVEKDSIQLVIQDDGVGFNANESEEKVKGLGLSNIKNLVLTFHGDIKIESALGKGTGIHIIIPLNLTKIQTGGSLYEDFNH